MQIRKDLDPVIDELYASALTHFEPNGLLEKIAGCAGYEVAAVVTTRSKYSNRICRESFGIDQDECERAEQHFGVSGTLTTIDARDARAGEFGFREEFVSDAEFRNQPFYHEFVVPNRIQDGAKLCLENTPDCAIYANLARPVAAVSNEQRRQVLETLAPHWARAMRIHLKLCQVEVLRTAYWEMTNITPFPIVMIDNACTVYLTNRKAESMLRGDGLSLASTGLHATLDSDEQRLQQAMRTVVASTASSRHAPQSIDLSISRPSGKRPYRLVITPVSPAREALSRRAAAAVVVFDPDSEPPVPVDRLRELFGFTRAEALVAAGIMQGKALEHIASSHGNTIATTRNLLKRVFVKAGVNRQSELTMVMLNSPLLFDIPNLAARPAVLVDTLDFL